MHISDWMPSKTLEEGEPHIHGANRNASDFLPLIARETFMDGINPISPVSFDRPQPREAPRATGCVHGAVLMAIIVGVTLITILALDYASIQLPTGDEPLAWPLLGSMPTVKPGISPG